MKDKNIVGDNAAMVIMLYQAELIRLQKYQEYSISDLTTSSENSIDQISLDTCIKSALVSEQPPKTVFSKPKNKK